MRKEIIPRPIIIDGEVARVPLTMGYEAIIDAADVPMVAAYNWFALAKRRKDRSIWTVYAVRNVPRNIRIGATVFMHRQLMNAPAGVVCDHVDGDGLNNRRSNLRFATVSQNTCNQRIRVTNKSGYKGGSWNSKEQKWVAIIGFNKKRHFLGRFDDPREASRTYQEASKRLHGEFARAE